VVAARVVKKYTQPVEPTELVRVFGVHRLGY
jgi:hypothetical protein